MYVNVVSVCQELVRVVSAFKGPFSAKMVQDLGLTSLKDVTHIVSVFHVLDSERGVLDQIPVPWWMQLLDPGAQR